MAECVAVAVKILGGPDILKALEGLSILKELRHPDEDIIRYIENFNIKIDQIRDDIKELEKMIKWEMTTLQYADVVLRIKLGMQHCIGIAKGIEKAEKDNQERLKELCANQSFTLALEALLDGMTGTGLFQKSILDEFYNQTKGDRPKISALATRLQELVCGGMVVLATYETVVRGQDSALEVTKKYRSRLTDVNAKVQSVLDTCVEKFNENMFSDLTAALDAASSGDILAIEVSNFLRDKYDWLENFCLIFTPWTDRWDQCSFDGDRIECLNRNGKSAVVFYREKCELPRFSNRYNEAYAIVNEVYCGKSGDGNKNIVTKIKAKGIGWIGCVVIKRKSNLRFYGTFSAKIVCIDKTYTASIYKNATAMILLK